MEGVELELLTQPLSVVNRSSNRQKLKAHPALRLLARSVRIDNASRPQTSNRREVVHSAGGRERRPGDTTALDAVLIVTLTGEVVAVCVRLTILGWKEHVASAGSPLQAKVTLCGVPLGELTVTENGAAVCPAATESLDGKGALKVKLAAASRTG